MIKPYDHQRVEGYLRRAKCYLYLRGLTYVPWLLGSCLLGVWNGEWLGLFNFWFWGMLQLILWGTYRLYMGMARAEIKRGHAVLEEMEAINRRYRQARTPSRN